MAACSGVENDMVGRVSVGAFLSVSAADRRVSGGARWWPFVRRVIQHRSPFSPRVRLGCRNGQSLNERFAHRRGDMACEVHKKQGTSSKYGVRQGRCAIPVRLRELAARSPATFHVWAALPVSVRAAGGFAGSRLVNTSWKAYPLDDAAGAFRPRADVCLGGSLSRCVPMCTCSRQTSL